METTWMPKVAGILNIVSGAFGLFIVLIWALWFAFISFVGPMNTSEFHDFPISIMAIILVPIGIFLLAAGILAIIGGIYALRKKKWGLALAGSIAAFFGSSQLGVAAIIFTALSKKEFE
jgi:hypothetical protein